MKNENDRRSGLLEAYDFRIDPRAAFESHPEVPLNLVLRAREFPGAFVLWDKCDDEQGFLLCGDDPAELRAAWHEHYPEL